MKEHKIKQIPEDFIVKENSNVELEDSGDYSIFLMKKNNYTTERAIQQIANALHIERKRLGYAGNKDKVAVTAQNISIKHASKEKVEAIKLKDVELTFLGHSQNPISLGDLEGNSFEIIVRDIEKSPVCLKRIVNYFGEQRFSKNNAEIGEAIVKKDFKKAVDLVLDIIGHDEKKVIEHLKKNKNDFVGALKNIPWKILKLYVHAFQSKLWNAIAKECVEKDLKVDKIPLIGFATEVKDKKVKKIVDKIMQNNKITFRDFVIPAIPDLSSDGDERSLYAEIVDMKISELEKDELNKGKKKVKIIFSLGKGSYATEVIKGMF
ncbi:MAG: tRNA pseudouridine(13) synthase TruD [Nanoarchaeota archaeon]|nr:tRNA pseudouridine(13) synthase TruD [Nanoarchaeota archaeon]MBU1321179.1 tRNA pseudouridine(13) synthase TruD [Nanoarchaeota archaeon]MBU1598319.1 tRNA pseudouridine(13) synthase TruD [Nanoarchaeota archaeon]MBU2441105.1 tRNA pseudouridine(13) synthase TruD [Nanoarchaeota archaeon]